METLSYLSEDMQSMVEFYCLLYSDNMYVTFWCCVVENSDMLLQYITELDDPLSAIIEVSERDDGTLTLYFFYVWNALKDGHVFVFSLLLIIGIPWSVLHDLTARLTESFLWCFLIYMICSG